MYKTILVPVIFDETHDTQSSFLVAKRLAGEGASFTILHVMETVPAYAAIQIPGDILAKSRADLEHKLKDLAAGLDGAKTGLAEGHAGRRIVDHAKANEIDWIVMASHRHGLRDVFIGSTADWVVRHANCSVHVIR